MAGWFSRLIGRAKPAPDPAQAVRAMAPVVRATPRAVSTPGSVAESPLLFGVRRPLVGAKGGVAAFELTLTSALQQRLKQRGGPKALAAHLAMLLAAAEPLCRSGRAGLVSLPASVLVLPGVAQQACAGAMLCVQDLHQIPAELAAELRARGVRLGVPDGPPAQAAAADFVMLEATGAGLDTVMLSARRWREVFPALPLVGSGLHNVDEVERLLRNGFALAGGLLDRLREQPAPRPLNSAAHRICELLNHLALDKDTELIAQAVRVDVALSYRLLRYVNSAALGLQRHVESVDAAVMLLGRVELQRWLQVLLLSVSESRQASLAVQESALARGRLLENLAQESGEPAAQVLFTVGLMSMLEVVLQVPLATALQPLRLGDAALQALLHRQGIYADYLNLAEALDNADGPRIEALAPVFGGTDVVQALAAQAWIWAAELTQASNPASPAAVRSPSGAPPARVNA